MAPRPLLRSAGEPGDLYVFIGVKAHPELRREGVTIHSGAPPWAPLAGTAHVLPRPAPALPAPSHLHPPVSPSCFQPASPAVLPSASPEPLPPSPRVVALPTQPACLRADVRDAYIAALPPSLTHHSVILCPPDPPPPLHADVEISYIDAILGTTVKVTTLGNNELSTVDLKIPAGEGASVVGAQMSNRCGAVAEQWVERQRHERDAGARGGLWAAASAQWHPQVQSVACCTVAGAVWLRACCCTSCRIPPSRTVLTPLPAGPSCRAFLFCRHAARHHAGDVQARCAQAGHRQRTRRPPCARQGGCAVLGAFNAPPATADLPGRLRCASHVPGALNPLPEALHPPPLLQRCRSRSPRRSAARSASSWSSCASCRRPSRRPVGGAGSERRHSCARGASACSSVLLQCAHAPAALQRPFDCICNLCGKLGPGCEQVVGGGWVRAGLAKRNGRRSPRLHGHSAKEPLFRHARFIRPWCFPPPSRWAIQNRAVKQTPANSRGC